ncbi:MAG: hypothetical protein MZW92_13120 [Comamonadaceae bacterium]|nr:hypothetical protein [Comamonadaceae bacterium]
MAAEIKPVWPRAKIVGPALTVRTFPADNLMIHKAVTLATAGRRLGDQRRRVQGLRRCSAICWAYSCKVHGLAGVVIDGASPRRRGDGQPSGFPVFARAVLPHWDRSPDSPGSINVPDQLRRGGGTARAISSSPMETGWWWYRRTEAAEVLAKALEIPLAKEEQLRGRLAKGEYTYDVLKLEDVLKTLGVVEGNGRRGHEKG